MKRTRLLPLLLLVVASCDDPPPWPPCDPMPLTEPWSDLAMPAWEGGTVCGSDSTAAKIAYPEKMPRMKIRNAFAAALAKHGFREVSKEPGRLSFDTWDGERGIMFSLGLDAEHHALVVDIRKYRNKVGELW